MKVCAACHTDLPKESYSKKQWKLDQRRCKVCITNNRAVQPISSKQDSNDGENTNEIIQSLDSMCLENVEKISDEELFKQPQPAEDCPICFLLLPLTGWIYMPCCGKVICGGCCHAPVYDDQGNKVDNKKCPFCRTPHATDAENIKREKKRIEAGDAQAIHNLGVYYDKGMYGLPQNHTKALELYHRAGELGCSKAYVCIGYSYHYGEGVEIDKKKAKHYYELAAMAGDVEARYNLGNNEVRAGKFDRAVKHYMIAVGDGDNDSLKIIQQMYSIGKVTKEDYTKALQAYQSYLVEIKSSQRDEAAAYDDHYLYY